MCIRDRYKTQLDIRFYHEKDYYEKLEAEIKAMKADQEAAENEGNNTPSNDNGESESQTEEETVLNLSLIHILKKHPAFWLTECF